MESWKKGSLTLTMLWQHSKRQILPKRKEMGKKPSFKGLVLGRQVVSLTLLRLRKELSTALSGGGGSRESSPKPLEPLLPGENPKFPTFSDAVRIRSARFDKVLDKAGKRMHISDMRRVEVDLLWLPGRSKWGS